MSALPVVIQALEFEEKVGCLIRQFPVYEDRGNHEKALAYIAQFQAEQNEETRILKLLDWFKGTFFKWMRAPPCPMCLNTTQPLGKGNVTSQERQDSASRVETFNCSSCYPSDRERVVARFPRYDNPVKLLETRTGRSFEWANCFVLLCRALGYEVRLVSDWTDHNWVEIFLTGQDRWVHCDPCENAFDKPLLYESGWLKKLTYIIAVSHDDIQDVTWRYSNSENHKHVLSRRMLVPETWLKNTILKLRENIQKNVTPIRKEILQNRLAKEVAEFNTPTKPPVESELKARISGALQWRHGRHETGIDNKKEGYEWDIASDKKEAQIFTLGYNSVEDMYFAGPSTAQRQGWQKGVYHSVNMFRKEEVDRKIVFLARKANEERGSLSWKFTNSSDVVDLQTFEFTLESTTFHRTAQVWLDVESSNGMRFQIPSSCCTDGKWKWASEDGVQGSEWIVLTCHLEGGEGELAWQDAQIFRKSTRDQINRPCLYPLHVKITLSPIQEYN